MLKCYIFVLIISYFMGNVTSIKNKLNKNYFIIILYIWDVTVTSHVFTDYQTFKYKSM